MQTLDDTVISVPHYSVSDWYDLLIMVGGVSVVTSVKPPLMHCGLLSRQHSSQASIGCRVHRQSKMGSQILRSHF